MDKSTGHFPAQELLKGEEHSEEIDELNDETFGDGAVDNDWEAFHFAAVNENQNSKQVQVPNKQQQQQNLPQNDILSKFNDFTLKELWDNNDLANKDDNTTIWSPLPNNNKTTPVNKVMTLEDVERDILLTNVQSSSPPVQPHSFPPHVLHSPTSLSQSPPQPPPPPPAAAAAASPYPTPPPGGIFIRSPMQYHVPRYPVSRQRRPLLQQPPMPHPYMMHPRGPPLCLPPNIPIMGPPRIIPGRHVHRPQKMGHSQFHSGPHPHHTHQNMPPPSSKLSELLCDLKPDGSGFMTRKEKEWVIKVQLMQLHSTSPEIDDYYYQHYIQKKILQRDAKEGVVSSNEVTSTMTLPPPVEQNKKRETKREFENVLGKVSTGSVVAPRKTIDIAPPTIDSNITTSNKSTTNKRRCMLLIIEEIFNILLKLDDLEGQQLNDKDAQIQELSDRIFELTKLKLVNEEQNQDGELFFQQILHYKKGKKAFQRFLPYFSEPQAKIALMCLTKSIATVVKKDNIDKVLPDLVPSINSVILTLSISEIIQHVTHFISVITQKLIDNQFFANYLTSLIKRSSSLVLVDTAMKKEWESILQQLNNSLSQLKRSTTVLDLIGLLDTPLSTASI